MSDFIGTIVSDIRYSDTPEVFADALMLMNDITEDDLEELSGTSALEMFSSGLIDNQIIHLCEFSKWLT